MLLAEKLSPLVRSMALLSLLIDLLTNRKKEFPQGVLHALDEEGTKGKEDTLSDRRPAADAAMGHAAGDLSAGDPVLRDRRQAARPRSTS